jgi:hypothetical protein
MGCQFKAFIVHVGIINVNYGKQTYLSKAMKFKLKEKKNKFHPTLSFEIHARKESWAYLVSNGGLNYTPPT